MVGDPRATDAELLRFAADGGFVVFTHDLDFGALLASSGARGPSVVQLRSQDVLPEVHLEVVVSALDRFAGELEAGALVTIDPRGARTRLLPLRR